LASSEERRRKEGKEKKGRAVMKFSLSCPWMPFNGAMPDCKQACLFRGRFAGSGELIRSPSGFPCSSGLKLRFPSNRAFPVPAPEKLQEKTGGSLSCAARAVPRIFLFLGMEVSPEFEKLLQDGLQDVFSIRPACLFFL
jgi:hypothetical protein